MATVTKTFKENQGSNHATWTLTATGTDVNATGNTVNVPVPTITARYTYSGKNGAWAYVNEAIFVVGGVDTGNRVSYGAEYAEGSWSSGASKTLPRSNTTFSIPTNTLFNSNNKTVRNVSVYFNSNASRGEGAVSLCSWKGVMADLWDLYEGYCGLWGPLETVTLNAPPIVTYTAPTYATPHYAGLGAYSVTVTSASAQYGGDIQSITLKIGNEEQSQSYSSATVTNQTLSLTPTIAGTYTPTIIVTDTRGQITTVNLAQITVNAYTAPSISFDLQRTNSSGVPNAEGEYGLVTASISYTDAIAELTQPTVAVRDEDGNLVASSAAWYETWDATNGVSDAVNWTDYNPQSPVTLYAVVSATGSSFSPNESYTVSITPTDNQGGVAQTITQTLSTGFFTIDFKAGGKEIAFGAPANDDITNYPEGLFKCAMSFVNVNMVGEIKAYAGVTLPNGWLECDGSEVLKADYPILYGAIADSWGVASDADHFVLPNMKGRVPVGYDSSDTDFDSVGESGGAKSVTLGTDEIPAHTHGNKSLTGVFRPQFYSGQSASGIVSMSSANYNLKNPGSGSVMGAANVTINASHEHTSVGGGNAHNNLQPYAVVKYIICAI